MTAQARGLVQKKNQNKTKQNDVLTCEERETSRTYLAKALAAFLAWTSLLIRMVSRLTGLGTKPTTPSSFTGRPIHHSLLNFCSQKGEIKESVARLFRLTPTSTPTTSLTLPVWFRPLWHGGSLWPQRWRPGPVLERCRRLPACMRSCNVLQKPRACTVEAGSQKISFPTSRLRQHPKTHVN